MFFHHFFMEHSALIRIFGLYEDRDLSGESPWQSLIIRWHLFAVEVKKRCILNQFLFRPLRWPGRRFWNLISFRLKTERTWLKVGTHLELLLCNKASKNDYIPPISSQRLVFKKKSEISRIRSLKSLEDAMKMFILVQFFDLNDIFFIFLEI